MKKIAFTIFALALVGVAANAQSSLEDVRSIVSDVKTKYAPDKRQVVYDVETKIGEHSGRIVVSGKTSSPEARQALSDAFDAIPNVVDSVVLLPQDRWGLTRISVACHRTRPAHAGEMATQSIMGMPVRILEQEGGWYRAQTPDGYIGWVTDVSVTELSPEEMQRWRNADRLIVTAPYQTRAYYSEDANGLRDVVTDLVLGNIVEGQYDINKQRLLITLPDGRQAWVATADVEPFDRWAKQPFDVQKILDQAYSMEGSPYLWGGTSIKTLDCSGLAKVCYLSNGIILMRDASQQALTGERIEAENWRDCQAGDLLFFGNAKTGKVTHVAIYDNNGNYVHSSGRVKRNSVDPESDAYLTTPFLHAVRIHGYEGTPGITRVENHPWYFNK